MGTVVITGVAGGIGRAVRDRLESEGHTIIGVDVRDAEVTADLSTAGGRRLMARDVDELCGGTLDGLVVGAGRRSEDGAAVVSINYFGAVATLESLQPMLEHGTDQRAVVIGSNAASTQADYPIEVAEWCLADDEQRARQTATDGEGAYAATSLALALWARRNATNSRWIGSGIRLNVVAPGFIDTPMTSGTWDAVRSLGDTYPIPQGRPGRVEEVAGLIGYLISSEAAYFCGSVIVMDGGTEAALRPDAWPRPLGL